MRARSVAVASLLVAALAAPVAFVSPTVSADNHQAASARPAAAAQEKGGQEEFGPLRTLVQLAAASARRA